KLKAPVLKAITTSFRERDETADICLGSDGQPEADKSLTDTENVPLREDIHDYFKREVLPHAPDAWIDLDYVDERDSKVGRVGYEIPFNRHFYVYKPPRALEDIDAELKIVTGKILEMIGGLTR
ncbi:MAG: SAM-dependent DNA methyltransferase, partial [Quisquiliibacterium sp.]